ncbi:hypothetical protein D931_04045 [Enterococcus faecium 13.SD.W.09]|nr:hypothetical protein D931_04045 [Enterococcus faecium 13.SD.W.09]
MKLVVDETFYKCYYNKVEKISSLKKPDKSKKLFKKVFDI